MEYVIKNQTTCDPDLAAQRHAAEIQPLIWRLLNFTFLYSELQLPSGSNFQVLVNLAKLEMYVLTNQHV